MNRFCWTRFPFSTTCNLSEQKKSGLKEPLIFVQFASWSIKWIWFTEHNDFKIFVSFISRRFIEYISSRGRMPQNENIVSLFETACYFNKTTRNILRSILVYIIGSASYNDSPYYMLHSLRSCPTVESKIEHLTFWWQPSFYPAFYFNFVTAYLYLVIFYFSISYFNYNWKWLFESCI